MRDIVKPEGWRGKCVPDTAFFDLSHWPIVMARFPELAEENRVARLLDGLDSILDEERPYVVIWQIATHDHDDEPHEDEKISNQWIKRRKADLNKFCRGYVYVVSDPAFREEFEEHLDVVRDRLFVFPMEIAQQQSDAFELARRMLGKQEANV